MNFPLIIIRKILNYYLSDGNKIQFSGFYKHCITLISLVCREWKSLIVKLHYGTLRMMKHQHFKLIDKWINLGIEFKTIMFPQNSPFQLASVFENLMNQKHPNKKIKIDSYDFSQNYLLLKNSLEKNISIILTTPSAQPIEHYIKIIENYTPFDVSKEFKFLNINLTHHHSLLTIISQPLTFIETLQISSEDLDSNHLDIVIQRSPFLRKLYIFVGRVTGSILSKTLRENKTIEELTYQPQSQFELINSILDLLNENDTIQYILLGTHIHCPQSMDVYKSINNHTLKSIKTKTEIESLWVTKSSIEVITQNFTPTLYQSIIEYHHNLKELNLFYFQIQIPEISILITKLQSLETLSLESKEISPEPHNFVLLESLSKNKTLTSLTLDHQEPNLVTDFLKSNHISIKTLIITSSLSARDNEFEKIIESLIINQTIQDFSFKTFSVPTQTVVDNLIKIIYQNQILSSIFFELYLQSVSKPKKYLKSKLMEYYRDFNISTRKIKPNNIKFSNWYYSCKNKNF